MTESRERWSQWRRQTLPELLAGLDAEYGPEIAAVAARYVYGETTDRHRRPGVDPQ